MIKTKKVSAICKAYKRVKVQVVGDEAPTQWIGDGYGMYILAGVEPLNEFGLASVLDFTEKDVNNIVFSDSELPEYIFDDDCGDEVKIERAPERIIIGGSEYLIFRTDNNLIFIDELHLKPVVTDSQTNFFLRNVEHYPVLCVKKRLLLEAVINGAFITNETLENWFSDIAKTISEIQEHYMRPAELDDNEQLEL